MKYCTGLPRPAKKIITTKFFWYDGPVRFWAVNKKLFLFEPNWTCLKDREQGMIEIQALIAIVSFFSLYYIQRAAADPIPFPLKRGKGRMYTVKRNSPPSLLFEYLAAHGWKRIQFHFLFLHFSCANVRENRTSGRYFLPLFSSGPTVRNKVYRIHVSTRWV